MIEFGNLEQVKNTFVRKTGAVREQDWEGIKYRVILSNKGKKAAEEAGEEFVPKKESQFTVSSKTFDSLNLSDNGLKQFRNGDQVLLGVISDEDQATFMKTQTYKGEPTEKGKTFSNYYLEKDLLDTGIINDSEDKIGENQFLSLEEVEVEGLPDYIVSMYEIKTSSEEAATSSVADSDEGEDSESIADQPQGQPEVEEEESENF